MLETFINARPNSGTMLEDGEDAPSFSGTDQNGDTVKLSDFQGQTLVLYFYPEDATPGCTKEACSFRDSYEIFQEHGIAVVGVSADDAESHKEFAKMQRLPFSLIADPDREIIDAYDVRGSLGKAKRITYIINDNGVIEHVYQKVDTETHAEDILTDLNV